LGASDLLGQDGICWKSCAICKSQLPTLDSSRLHQLRMSLPIIDKSLLNWIETWLLRSDISDRTSGAGAGEVTTAPHVTDGKVARRGQRLEVTWSFLVRRSVGNWLVFLP